MSLIVLIISNILLILAYVLSKASYLKYESPYIGMLVITALFLYLGSFLFLFRIFLNCIIKSTCTDKQIRQVLQAHKTNIGCSSALQTL